MSLSSVSTDPRLDDLSRWLTEAGFGHVALVPAAADASFRRYFRLRPECGESLIVMDAPPDKESLASWLRISDLLARAGIHVPKIERADPALGFVVMEDLGDDSYARVHARGSPPWAECIDAALEALVRMQEEIPSDGLPLYDVRKLREEIDLFPVWLLGRHLGLETERVRRFLAPLSDRLVTEALSTPYRFTHRDYHSRNLLAGPPPRPGVIDFQDAVWGPVTYDLVSLLKDCYIDWPRREQKRWLGRYYDACPRNIRGTLDSETLLGRFDLMGVQRHLKAAGIFARLCWRDGKTAYLDSIPRTLGYITEAARERPLLEPLADFLQEHVFPHLDDARTRAHREAAACTP
jgi:aminoglycoside/choline kinase family phosphotransferase